MSTSFRVRWLTEAEAVTVSPPSGRAAADRLVAAVERATAEGLPLLAAAYGATAGRRRYPAEGSRNRCRTGRSRSMVHLDRQCTGGNLREAHDWLPAG